MVNWALENQQLGKINAPTEFFAECKNFETEIIRSFQLMIRIQPNENMAWGLACNNVISAWHGSRSLLKKLK